MFRRRLILIVLSLLLAGGIGWAQLDTASIVGTVLDSSGAVIPGAKVVVENMGTSAKVELTTGQNGIFDAPALAVGSYRVTVSKAGFNTYLQEGIKLNVADRIGLSIVLKPGAETQQITVVGEAPVVETASTTLGGLVGNQQVSELPLNGRALTQLLSTVPGVLLLGPPSMNGASMGRLFETATRFLLDGTDSGQVDSDLPDGGYGTAARMTRASVESIAEVKIQEASFDAEYGQASGGVVNFITKSGTNNLHGSLFEYFRNEVLDTRDFFSYVPPLKPAFRLNQYGGSLTGPIKRDKLFFFVDYEGDRQRLGVTQTGYVPTAAYRAALNPVLQPIINTLPLPDLPVSSFDPTLAGYTRSVSNQLREDTFAVKTDYNFTSKDRLSARYNFNDSFTYTYFGFAQGQARPIPYRSQLGKLTYTRTLTPNLLNEAGLGLNRVHAITGSGDGAAIKSLPITLVLGGVAPMGPGLFDLAVGNTSTTFLDTLSWVKGRNQFKFGTQISRLEVNKAVNFQNYLVFLSLANAPLSFGSNIPYELLTLGNPMEGQRGTLSSYFVQDDMQARKNLTLNLGLRYDYNTSITESHGRNRNFNFATGELDPAGTPVFSAPKTNFAPRVGFAWTPTASKKLVVRGGYGIFFITINPVMAQSTPANDPVFGQSRLVTFFQDPALTGFPTPPNIQSFPSSGALWVFPHDFHSAYNQDWNLNIQRSLSDNMVLQVAYIGNRGTHYLFFINANQIDPVTKVRPYAGFSDINDETPCCSTSYNALQVSLRRRMSHGLTFNVNYTWSHNLDFGGLNFGTTAEDSRNLGREWGNADYDVRHVLEFDYTYQLPAVPKSPKWLGKGWQINGLSVMRAGTSVDAICNCDPLSIGLLTSRANVVPGVSSRASNYSLPFNQYNSAAFSSPMGTGALGNAGRNTLKGPAVYNWDFSLFKNFRVKEHQTLEFRAEAFNIFNTPQFAAPLADISSPATFGQSLSTIGSAGGFGSNRQIQFALRYAF